MKLVMNEPKYLKDSISIISDFISEAVLEVRKDRINILKMDPANVCMVSFEMWSTLFSEFITTQEVEKIGLNLNNLKQILKRIDDKNSVLTIETKDNRCNLILKGSTVRTFTLPLIDIDDKETKVPALTAFSIKIKMPSASLQGIVEDIDLAGETIMFTYEDNKFIATGGEEGTRAEVITELSEEVSFERLGEGTPKGKYAIEYVKKMASGGKISKEVTIRFGRDYPLSIEYVQPDKMVYSIILAPRVDND